MRGYWGLASVVLVGGSVLALGAVACGGSSSTTSAAGGAGGGGAGGSAGASGTGGTGNDGGSGGTGGTGGTGGSAGPVVHADKVDLLVMVDNSASMADKQAVLAQTVPDLVSRLTNPDCVDPTTRQFVARVDMGAACPAGSEREFPAVVDMHVGIITSSLGGHGADVCSSGSALSYNPHMEDMSHLISRTASGGTVATWQSKGFLDWDPGAVSSPPGEADPAALDQAFSDMVRGAGEDGCGFEASLEAWYRFLIDPAPYQKMVPVPCSSSDPNNSCRGPSGIDQAVLQQRADFLREDSVVSIVMLTDEDDCSVQDSGQNYVAVQALEGSNPFHVARGTSACATAPASPDCVSCWSADPTAHPECASGWGNPSVDDPLNLRCYRQKQRFGVDFLYPIGRYVDALTKSTLDTGAPNPLFCKTASGNTCTSKVRDRSQIILAGIVGVPWQDIARDPSDLGKGYKTAAEIPWDVVAGDVTSYVDPTDPFMKPSVEPRSGTNPITGDAISPPGSPYDANPINGHDWTVASGADLQYACVFDLPQPLDCTQMDCECSSDTMSPLCQSPATGQYGTTQYRAKAYPGVRHLAVLHGIGSQAVVGSICAPNLTAPSLADYAYRPAISAVVDRIGKNLSAP